MERNDTRTRESDSVLIEKVTLERSWVFWENYNAIGNKTLDWEESIKQIFDFNDIVSFWQFWNGYMGSIPSEVFFDGERIR